VSKRRIAIQWTQTAKDGLAKLPLNIRRGLLESARKLGDVADPRAPGKPLIGPLQGYYRIRQSRYRAIYSVQEDKLANGKVLVYVQVRFVAVGIRKEGDKNDVYKLASKLMNLGLLDDGPDG